MNKFFDLIKQTYRRKSINRILMNWKIFEHCQGLEGVIIDLGGSKKPSYTGYWDLSPKSFIRVDIDPAANPDVRADINKPLPFDSNFADAVFLFSVLYIIKKPGNLMREIFRVLKPKGKLFLYSPFIFNEAKEPDDYCRFTSQGIEKLLREAGFKEYQVMAVGERFSAALGLTEKIAIFNTLKIPLRLLALFLDKIYPKKLKTLHPCPAGYFIKARKT